MEKHIAGDVQVSSRRQHHRSQLPDLERWAAVQELSVRYYRDTTTGQGQMMDRPGWAKLQAAIECVTVATVACWRLDRLGRTDRSLTMLFASLQERGVNLSVAAGRH